MELERVLTPEKFLENTPAERRRLILDFLQENPGKHDQSTWGMTNAGEFKRPTPELSCGTSACVAGWATIFAGYEPIIQTRGVYDPGHYFDTVILPDGSRSHVEEAARIVLGLDVIEANVLFSQDNNRDDIATMLGNLDLGIPIGTNTHHEDDDGTCDCGECDTDI